MSCVRVPVPEHVSLTCVRRRRAPNYIQVGVRSIVLGMFTQRTQCARYGLLHRPQRSVSGAIFGWKTAQSARSIEYI